jgi:vancomycin resistance protein VanJ
MEQIGFRKRLLRLVWRLLQIGIALYGLAVIVYLGARLTVGEDWNLVGFANNFTPWLLWAGFILGLVGLFSRYRRGLILLQLPGVIAFGVLYGHLLWPPGTGSATSGPALTVATFNVRHHSDAEETTAVLADLEADVIGIQELYETHAAIIQADLSDRYPYQVLYPKVYFDEGPYPYLDGVGLISRYPVIGGEVFNLEPETIRHLRVVIDVEGTPVTVFVLHPDNPVFFPPWQYDPARRSDKLAILRERIAAETNPVIVLCDCNLTDQSDDYRALDDLLNDAFDEVGWGMGFTASPRLKWLPPTVRIDYVWHSDAFTAQDAYVGDDHGDSDHYPVIAELALNADGSE